MKTSTSYSDAVAIRKKNLENIFRCAGNQFVLEVAFDSAKSSCMEVQMPITPLLDEQPCEYHPLTVDHIHDGSVLVKYHEQPNTLTLREAIEAWCMQLL